MHIVIAQLDATAAGTFAEEREKESEGSGTDRVGEREGEREIAIHSPPDYAGAQDKLVNSNQLN